ncbi:winged helix-turn-helix transcriptional regulator [Candidatus Gracilibacteria bacterium]|nr:winged helix-turn-helix transcriptional regulator [Candidatus Gracilibacteria bacterium]
MSTQKKCVSCFGLLADDTRLTILSKIRAGINQVKLLEKEMAVSQPTISHHLKALMAYGVIKATKHGRETKYDYASDFACHQCHVFETVFI